MPRYESLIETLELLCDQRAMRSIRRSVRQQSPVAEKVFERSAS